MKLQLTVTMHSKSRKTQFKLNTNKKSLQKSDYKIDVMNYRSECRTGFKFHLCVSLCFEFHLYVSLWLLEVLLCSRRLDFLRLPGPVFDPPRRETLSRDECGLIVPNSGW